MAFRTNKMPVLQEKSASGSVATFNTALAMPLPSCNIAVNAWQEGSGDPSPSNVRAIHGFSEVNATRCGINLWDEQWELGSLDYSGNPIPSTTSIRSKNYIKVNPSTKYFITFSTGKVYIACYDKDKKMIGYIPSTSGLEAPSEVQTYSRCEYIRLDFGSAYGTTYRDDTSVNSPSTDTDYHAYTGNIYTIQLGQEVYGAEVDTDGVAHVTHSKVVFDGSQDENWNYYSSSEAFYLENAFDTDSLTLENNSDFSCNRLYQNNRIAGSSAMKNKPDNSFNNQTDIHKKRLWVKMTQFNGDAEALKTWLQSNNLEIKFPLSTPFDIQLTPTQIETLIGNNTIFADTGDIDLTYKDLDIAKRGNFREVFKLPS